MKEDQHMNEDSVAEYFKWRKETTDDVIDKADIEAVESYENDYNSFARELLKKYVKNKNENVILSPFSVLLTLAIAADATRGVTRDEIANVLSNTMSFAEVRDLLCIIQRIVSQSNMFISANAVCVSHEIRDTIYKDYVATLHNRFGGELFATKHLEEDINKWVKTKTCGMIDKIYIKSCTKKR